MEYREFTIPKKNGKVRHVVAPDKELLKYQRGTLKGIQEIYMNAVAGTPLENVAHGFIRGRNVITAAEQHIGFKSTIMMDISDFFDTVTKDMLPDQLQDSKFYHKKGYCAQGFATSPLLANIASIDMITNINNTLSKMFSEFVLTIYADDIQISSNVEDYEKLNEVIAAVGADITAAGFGVNVKKTRIKYAKFGYRRILGVNVGSTEVRATRKVMRKIRAARHQQNGPSLGGLVNWSNCNLPRKQR